jgi:prepilin-type N-terminal cleavage/methylation domain-containing protein
MNKHRFASHRPIAPSGSRRGFTLVEIVVAFIIIGILTAIMVPSIARRSEAAKIAATESDLLNLANALERVSIDIGPIVRIYALDDVRRGNGVANTSLGDAIDGLSDNNLTPGNLYTNPDQLFIGISTQNFLPSAAQTTLFNRLVNDETSFSRWNGPYINWTRDANRNDWPDDAWGHDYLLFSREGILYPPDPAAVDAVLREDHSFAFEPLGPPPSTGGTGVTGIRFDRFVVLSLGPNGLPGDGSGAATAPEDPGHYGQGDDIFRAFGGQ